MKNKKFKEVDYKSMPSKEKIKFSKKITEQLESQKEPSKIKLFFAWVVWLLTYGVGIAFGFYMLYLMFLKPSPEVERLNKTIIKYRR